LLIRNPWGFENRYNQSWNAKDVSWTNILVAYVPLGIDPRNSAAKGGEFVVDIMNFDSCFVDY